MHLIKKNSQRANKHCEFFLMRCNYSQRAANQFLPWLEKTSSPGSLTADFFIYKYKTSAFVTGKCRLKVKIAGGTCQDGVFMATMRCARRLARGHQLQRCRHRVGLLVDLYSVSSRMSPRAFHRRHQYAMLGSSPASFFSVYRTL